LKVRVLNYLEYIHEKKESLNEKEEIDNVLNKLPKNLLYDIQNEINKSHQIHLEKSLLNTNNFSHKTLEKL
jgi:hypothetical protein